ncbi:MAG: winged helix-turn-helix domain-containing protein [Candidatus Poseidoniales archaeon]
MTIRAIRSRTHRKILHHLMDGPATVSELADFSGMKLPHMSLGCKQLRETGDIQRDDSIGIRGASLRLTTQGIHRIQSDMIHHMLRSKIGEFDKKMDAIVIKDEGSKVLIGYTKTPHNNLQFIPKMQSTRRTQYTENSNGNNGGTWISILHSEISWHQLSDGALTTPDEPFTGTLIDFQEPVKKIGLVWANIIHGDFEQQISEKQWFSSTPPEHEIPTFSEGEIQIGKIDKKIPYRITRGVFAMVPSSIERELIIQQLARHTNTAVHIQSTFSKMPFAVLVEWVKLIHPRLNFRKVESIAKDLLSKSKDGKGRPSKRLTDLRRDFQNVEWIDDEHQKSFHLSISGCNERGLRAVTEYLLQTTYPWVLEWNLELPNDDLLERCLSHQYCVAVITKQVHSKKINNANVFLRPSTRIGELDVQVSRSGYIPIHLDQANEVQINDSVQIVPKNAEMLIQMTKNQVHQDSKFITQSTAFLTPTLKAAIASYPNGDSLLANSIERQEPLASWIASPMLERSQRFERIHDQIPRGWIELIDMKLLSDEMLLKSVVMGGQTWQENLMVEINFRCINSPMFLLKLYESLQNENDEFTAAFTLFCVDFIEPTYQEMIDLAFETWINNPVLTTYVLEALFSANIHESNEERKRMLNRLFIQPHYDEQFTLLNQWLQYHKSNQNQLNNEFVQKCIELFPLEWWREDAISWFQFLSSSKSGRDWLAGKNIPWSIQLLWHPKPRTTMPGKNFSEREPQVIDIGTVERILSQIDTKNNHLLDLHLILLSKEQGGVPRCKTHPLLGWLSKPISQWPKISISSFSNDDPDIGQFLLQMYTSR